jgi:hypothetical protein
MVERQKMVGGDVKQRRHYVLDGRELGARKRGTKGGFGSDGEGVWV